MLAEFQSQPKRTLTDFSMGQIVATIVAAIVLSIIGAGVSVWVSQAQTLTRLSAVEEAQKNAVTREVLDARWKLVEKIDSNVEKLGDLIREQQPAKGRR